MTVCKCKRSKIILGAHMMPLTWGNVELRGFEPLTSCMPYMARLSEAVADLASRPWRVHGIAVLSEAVGVNCGVRADRPPQLDHGTLRQVSCLVKHVFSNESWGNQVRVAWFGASQVVQTPRRGAASSCESSRR